MDGKTGCSLFDLPGIGDLQELILHHLDVEARYEAALICREFYLSICRLEQNRTLKLHDDGLIEDNEVFESMLYSSRRFKEIEVDPGYPNCERTLALSIGVVLAKFKSHLKKLVVYHFPMYSRALSSPIMDAMADVEELSLFSPNEDISLEGCFDLQRDFTKLKRLCLDSDLVNSGILNKIPDDTLESLTIGWPYGFLRNEARLQAFLNRQKTIRKLEVLPKTNELELGHLELQELTLKVEGDNALAAVLKQQPNLRVLSCNSIGSASFKELQKMRKLEVLQGSFTGQMRGELANLKELQISGDTSILQQVASPNLTTLRVVEDEPIPSSSSQNQAVFLPQSLRPEYIVALGRSATNLGKMSVRSNSIEFLPAIFENFAKLKTLKLKLLARGALFFQPPSRPNLSLEELIIERQVYGHETPDTAIYQTIALCPNLERISLREIIFTKHEILNLIHSLPTLTHFWFESENEDEQLFDEHGVNFLDPTLMAIIDIFRNSPKFISLHVDGIADWGEQPVEDVFAGDADQFAVDWSINWAGQKQIINLSLTKKVHDPHKNFHRN